MAADQLVIESRTQAVPLRESAAAFICCAGVLLELHYDVDYFVTGKAGRESLAGWGRASMLGNGRGDCEQGDDELAEHAVLFAARRPKDS
jgi:hypothetical protein